MENYKKMKSTFESFGNPDTRAYETKQNVLCKTIEETLSLKEAKDVYQYFFDYIKYYVGQKDLAAAYHAFYFMSIYTRRKEDYEVFFELNTSYKNAFKSMSTYTHLINIYHLSTSIPSDKYEEILECGYINYKKFENHAGIVHCFADIVATISEDAILCENPTIKTLINTNYLAEAIKAADEAINLSEKHYAKFYSTKGRLLTIDGQPSIGKHLIYQAISYENNDHRERISYYKEQLKKSDLITLYSNISKRDQESKNKVEALNQKISNDVQSFEKDVDDKLSNSTIKNIEILTFFTGLIGFLVSSISIAVNADTLSNAYNLIIIVFASFLTIFSFMDAIIKLKYDSSMKQYYPNIIAFLFGVVIVIIVYFT